MAEHGTARRPNVAASSHHDPFRSVAVCAHGVAMHAVVAEASAAAPIAVLVHGLGLSHRYMMPLARALAPSHRVHVPDLPGFGDSGHPDRTLDMAELADALADWMQAMGIARAALVGNSQACQVIAHLAVRHPERVAAAVLQGPTAPADERTWVWQFIRWRQNGRFNPPAMNRIAWSDYRRCGHWRVLRTFLHSLRDPIERQVRRMAAPTLIVRGACDPICRDRWARALAAQAPNGRFVEIPRVAHTLVFTAPRELAAVTRSFLADCASG